MKYDQSNIKAGMVIKSKHNTEYYYVVTHTNEFSFDVAPVDKKDNRRVGSYSYPDNKYDIIESIIEE